LPAFFTSKVIFPAFSVVDASAILNSDSVTATVVACDFGAVVVVCCWVVVAGADVDVVLLRRLGDLLRAALLLFRPEDLDRGQHPEEEHEGDDDERRQPAPRILRPESRKQEGRGEREGDERRASDGEPNLMPRRERERHGRILRG
jgi:hypothetical protein